MLDETGRETEQRGLEISYHLSMESENSQSLLQGLIFHLEIFRYRFLAPLIIDDEEIPKRLSGALSAPLQSAVTLLMALVDDEIIQVDNDAFEAAYSRFYRFTFFLFLALDTN